MLRLRERTAVCLQHCSVKAFFFGAGWIHSTVWSLRASCLLSIALLQSSSELVQSFHPLTQYYLFISVRSSIPNIVRVIKSRRMRWAGHVALMGEERGTYRVLVGKPEGKRPLGRPRRRWVDNIRMDLQEVGCGYVDWIGLAQDRNRWWTLVSAVMNLRVP